MEDKFCFSFLLYPWLLLCLLNTLGNENEGTTRRRQDDKQSARRQPVFADLAYELVSLSGTRIRLSSGNPFHSFATVIVGTTS